MANSEPHITKLVKRIDFDTWSDKTMTTYLQIFAMIFPFVNELNFPSLSRGVCSTLTQIRNGFNCLGDFGEPSNNKELKLYMKCALRYRNTLTTLFLCDNMDFFGNTRGIRYSRLYSNLIEKLEEFHKLCILEIKRLSNENIESFDSVIEKCQALTEIHFTLCPNDVEVSTSAGTLDLSVITPRPMIERVIFPLLSIHNDKSLLYIMYKFPQLKYLSINRVLDKREDKEYKDWESYCSVLLSRESNVTSAMLNRFLYYAISIHAFNVNIQAKIPVINDVLFECSSTTILNKLRTFTLEYDPFCPKVNEEAVNEQNATLVANQGQRDYHFHGIGIRYNTANHEFPHLVVIDKLGGIINELAIFIQEDKIKCISKETHRDAYNMVMGYFLDHLFKSCPNLTKLCLYGPELIHCNSNNMSRSDQETHTYTKSELNGYEFDDINSAGNLQVYIRCRSVIEIRLTVNTSEFENMTIVVNGLL